jgi:hypothetical protein
MTAFEKTVTVVQQADHQWCVECSDCNEFPRFTTPFDAQSWAAEHKLPGHCRGFKRYNR